MLAIALTSTILATIITTILTTSFTTILHCKNIKTRSCNSTETT